MNYRQFGKTDLFVSEIGFGAWAIGGEANVGGTAIGWGPANDAVSEHAILTALDSGINFFDTADFYGLGHSEKILGKALKNKEAIIATKVGHRNVDDSIVLDYTKEHIINACEKSLRRLNRDVIDFYQLHSARLQHLQWGDCIEAMELLKDQGKIRYWGLSLNTFHPKPEADYLIKRKIGDGFQLVFNLINQRASGVMQEAGKAGYGIIARMPLQFGLLTGKFTTDSKFDNTDHRNFRLTKDILNTSLKILEEKVWSLQESSLTGKTALALNFILSHPEVSTVIPGLRTPRQVIENISGLAPLHGSTVRYLQDLKPVWSEVVEMMERLG